MDEGIKESNGQCKEEPRNVCFVQSVADSPPDATTLTKSCDGRSRTQSDSSSSVNNLTVGKSSSQVLALAKKRLDPNDSEDDFNDESVNLVALEEIASSKYSK